MDDPGGGRDHDDGGSPALTLYLVKRLELAIRRELDATVRKRNLTTLQYTALSVLKDRPAISSAQLSRRSFVSSQAGNEMVSILERKGLIERGTNSSNKKVLEIFLTERGHEILRDCEDEVREIEERMLAGLAPREIAFFRSLIDTCVRSLTG